MLRRALALLALALFAAASQAGVTRFCDRTAELTAQQQDTLLRFGGVIKGELEKSGGAVAILSRSGLDLSRFKVRYSHAGVSLKQSGNTPWSVRQLYYACDEKKPRIFDQGIAGFLMGTDDPSVGYVSMLLLPADAAASLERAALDDRQALKLLGATYSANAYPFSERYQNCNQWLVELLATAWGGDDVSQSDDVRGAAQAWLKSQSYAPHAFDVGSHLLMTAGAFVPWVHSDDHPSADIERLMYRVSMPSSIEAFVHANVPGAKRIEFCHVGTKVVVHEGWQPIGEGCEATEGDRVTLLD
jgi:hypothetical protein